MTSKIPLVLLVISLGVAPTLAHAQPAEFAPASRPAQEHLGMLEGRVINEHTAIHLQGARVELLNTGFRTVSEEEGRFRIPQLPAGTYTVRVSYPGLDSADRSIEIPPDGRVELDFALTSDVYELEKFVVVGEREGGAFALAMQRDAFNVKNVLSADTFGTLPNQNLATFVERMSGVSTIGTEGNPITIRVRGIDPSLNSVTMDGTRLASGGPKNDGSRGVEMDKIPGDFIDSVELTKAATPDMDADSIGGSVNVKTKNPFTFGRQVARYTAGSSYTENRGGGLRPYGSLFFSSMLGEKQNFGVLLTANYNDYWMERGAALQTHQQATPRNRSFFNGWEHDTVEQIRSSVAAQLYYRPDKSSTYDFKILLSDYDDTYVNYQTRFTLGTTAAAVISEDELVLDTTNSTYTQTLGDRLTKTKKVLYRIGGEHNWDRWRLNYNASYNTSRGGEDRVAYSRTVTGISFRTDRRNSLRHPEFTQLSGPDITDLANTVGHTALLTLRRTDDLIAASKADLSRHFYFMQSPALFKTGLSYRYQHKDGDRTLRPFTYAKTRPELLEYLSSFDHGHRVSVEGKYPSLPFLDLPTFRENFGRNRIHYTEDLTSGLRNSLVNDWDAEETVMAAYAMGSVNFGKISVLAGLRAERTNLEGTGFREDLTLPVPDRFGTATEKASYSNAFPSAHFRYEPFNGLLIRASLSTGIGRPSFQSVVGREIINEVQERITANNPNLGPQRARSLDLSVEYYFEPAGVISATFFTKEIRDFIYANQSILDANNRFGPEYDNWELRDSRNGGKGTIEGFEISYQQQLSFLKGFLGGVGVFANYTKMETSGYFELENERTTLPGFVPDIVNAGVFYDRAGVTAKLLFNYQSTHMITFNANPFSRLYEYQRHKYDFQAGYAFSRKLSLQLSVTNLTNTAEGRLFGDESRWNRYKTLGRVVSLGVRGEF